MSVNHNLHTERYTETLNVEEYLNILDARPGMIGERTNGSRAETSRLEIGDMS